MPQTYRRYEANWLETYDPREDKLAHYSCWLPSSDVIASSKYTGRIFLDAYLLGNTTASFIAPVKGRNSVMVVNEVGYA
jgi:hypothetical protein